MSPQKNINNRSRILKFFVYFTAKSFKHSIVLFILLFLLLAIGTFTVNNKSDVNGVSQFIQNHDIAFMVWRYSMMAVVCFFYPEIIKKIFNSKEKIDPQKLAKISQRRWIILAFIVYELVIVHNVLSPFINWALGF